MPNIINRHDLRIVTMRSLVALDLQKVTDLNDAEILPLIAYAYDCDQEFDELYSLYKNSFDEINQKIVFIYEHLLEIDNVIIHHLDNYTIDRLNYTDRAIIRYAVYEMMYTDTPHNIIINEAIEITKEYSNLDDGLQSKFSNSLLDKINKEMTK